MVLPLHSSVVLAQYHPISMTAVYQPERSDYLHVLTVYTAPGRVTFGTTVYPKARLWVLEDHRVVIVVPGPEGRGVERIEAGNAAFLRRTAARQMTADLESEQKLVIEEADCACGMGAAGSAGPVEGRWKIERVRAPEWYILSS